MKKVTVIAAIVLLVSAVFAYAAAPKQSTTISIVGKTFDGTLAGFTAAGIKPIVLDKPAMLTAGKTEWLGVEKESGVFYVAFGPDALYVTAVIKSPQGIKNPNSGKDTWNGNAAEVFIGFDNSDPSREMYTESDFQLGFNPGKISKKGKVETAPEVYCFNQEKTITDAKITSKKTADGYIITAKIPAKFFASWNVANGQEISFDASIDEMGPKGLARKVQLTWSGYADSYKNPAGWGTATLKAAK
jgi:hypothetical protein